jgi:hypothetical protein
VHQLCGGLDKAKIILNEAAFDEGALAGMHELIQPRCQAISEDFGDKLPYHVDQKDRAIVLNSRSIRRLRQQHHQNVVGLLEVTRINIPERIERRHDV